MAALDFRRCPHCGEADFDLRSEERLYGYGRPKLGLSDTGEIERAEWAGFDVDWSESTVTRYFCGGCNEDLPAAYQDALDAALGTQREPE